MAAAVDSPAVDLGRLRDLIRANREHLTRELMWGSPGTMLAARSVGLDDEWRESADLLWASWEERSDVWTQRMYGKVTRYLGPAHGFAGNVHALRGYLSGEVLRRRAGPLRKGPGLCHGTAGNGFAFLRLCELSGDPRWLQRVRCFAMHAIEQVNRQRAGLGRGRYTLWTGDIGVALYLDACIQARAAFPTIDTFSVS